jgi:hypothetical protein
MKTKEVSKITVVGYPEETLCGSSCGDHGCASCGSGLAARMRTDELFREFESLMAASEYRSVSLEFVHAESEGVERYPEIAKLLAVASLSPVVAIDGSPFCWGGFSPEGMMAELRKRYPRAEGENA